MTPGGKLDDFFAFAYHAWFRDSLPREVDFEFSQELMQSGSYFLFLINK